MSDKHPNPSPSGQPVGQPDDHWPPRTQRLLGELRALCGNWLHKPLLRSLDHFDMCLHQQAASARSHLEQTRYQATRQTFDQRFIASIDQAFDRLGQPTPEPVAEAKLTLSLVDPTEHELTTSLDQLVTRSEVRSGAQLLELGYRLAALIAVAPLEGDALPIGPQAMAKAFCDASKTLNLSSQHELLLLQSLEGRLFEELPLLHELANAHLQADGILLYLRPFALPRTTPRRERAPEPNLSTTPALPTSKVPTQLSAMPDKTPDPSGRPSVPARGHISTSNTVGSAELQAALVALQEHLVLADEQDRLALRDPQHLREELLIQLNVGRSSDVARAILTTEQDNAVEMIVRLFAQIAQQLPQNHEAQSLLANLQLPMLRAALNDHRFFEQHEHPARKWLGKITEIARDWLDDSHDEIDRTLRTKLGQLVNRAGREPPSAGLYASLLNDIEQYLEQLQHKTQLAERRQVEAMQGLERLEQARHRTAELLSTRFAPSSPQHLRLGQLDSAWSGVLALTLLRHGEKSEVFGARLIVTDQLLGALPVGDRRKLRDEVDAGLRQIGLHGDKAAQVAQKLIDARHAKHGGDSSDAASSTRAGQDESSQRLHRVPSENSSTGGSAMRDSASVEPSPEVLRIHRHLRSLPAGIWFEFIDPSGQHGKRLRLVWYSPLTGHSLFVTRAGQRAEEFDQLQLAHEITCGHIRELASDHDEDVLDHAWHIVAEELAQPHRPLAPGTG